MNNHSLLLYAVTDTAWLCCDSLEHQVEQCLRGGATTVQLREKSLPLQDFINRAHNIKSITDKYHVPLIINDEIAVMQSCGATGLHIGQHDMPADRARMLIGPGKILGVSVQTVDQAIAAEKSGADYLGVGAMFPTDTKQDADAVTPQTLREICSSVCIPVVAIGGITTQNIPLLSGTGIAGAAIVSAIFASKDIENATKQLKNTLQEVLG